MQNFLSSMPYHAIFGFLIPLLVAVLQLRVQGITKSLFEEYPTNMWTFLLAATIYCLAFAADMKFKHLQASSIHNSNSFSQLFGAVAIISGSLSCVSLFSIFIPHSHGYIIFLLWAFVPTVVVYQYAASIEDAYDWLQQKIKGDYELLQQKIKYVYDWLHEMIHKNVNSLKENSPCSPV